MIIMYIIIPHALSIKFTIIFHNYNTHIPIIITTYIWN